MKTITEDQINLKGEEVGIDPDLIRTVLKVESPRGGHDAEGNSIILFEGHVFYKNLSKFGISPMRVAQSNPDICYKSWTKKFYSKSNSGEWKRLERAQAIHSTAANMSASWGRFQILGENFRSAGYESVDSMINNYYVSEEEQLDSFIKFLIAEKLMSILIAKDWTSFARRYNGPGYAENKYHIRLREEYEKLKKA
jgi:hypothetical protein